MSTYNRGARISPEVAEREMQEARECRMINGRNIPFSGDVEISYVYDAVKTAKNNGRIGDKIQLLIDPLYIHIPEWQRDIRSGIASQIAENYNPAKWDCPKVISYRGRLVVIDGEHRIYGAFKGKRKEVVVELLDIPMKDAVEIFINQSNDKVRMSQSDYIKAAVSIKMERYMVFRNICKKHSVRIKGDYIKFVKNPVGMWTNLHEGLDLAEKNPDMLENILSLIGRLEWNGNTKREGGAYSSKVTRALKKLYAYNKGREREMEAALCENCKGAAYFDENLRGKWDREVFDFLSNIIAGAIGAPAAEASPQGNVIDYEKAAGELDGPWKVKVAKAR